MLQDKLHQAVAESAHAVVEKDRIGGICHVGVWGVNVPHPFIRPFRSLSSSAYDPGLTPRATILRRFAAAIICSD